MCENQIEKAVKIVNGVSKADWNKEKKILEVTFDEAKTNTDKIKVVAAKVGYDN